jgi:hypothetical protein
LRKQAQPVKSVNSRGRVLERAELSNCHELLKKGEAFIMHMITFADLKKGLEKEFSTGATIILYIQGKNCGKRSCRRLMGKYRDKTKLLNIVTEYKKSEKWGVIEFSVDLEKGEGNIIVRESFEAKQYGYSPVPVCHFLRGYLAGVLGEIMGKDITVIETECIARGSQFCLFEIVPFG